MSDGDGIIDLSTKEEKKIRKLKERKLELELLIQAVELNLKRNGYLIDDMKSTLPQPGIRINEKLSFRGKEKSKELYLRLDEDLDGQINFKDIRAMHSLSSHLGLVEDPKLLRSETWEMAMADLGVKTHNTYLKVEDFIKYRELIESTVPLSSDLMKTNLGYLPYLQKRWIRVKKRIQECFDVRSADYTLEKDPDLLSLSEVSFILSTTSSQLRYSKYDFKLAMCFIARFDTLMTHLLSKSLRRDLFLELPENVAGETGGFLGGKIIKPIFMLSREFVSYIRPEALIAWIFSRRTPPTEGLLYRTLLGMKYNIWRGIRYFYKTSYYLWDIGLHLRERLVFKQQCIPSIEDVDTKLKTSFRVNCVIGTPTSNGTEDGTNIFWKFNRLENLPNYLTSLGLPKDIGSGIVIDLTRDIQEESTPEMQEYIAKTCIMIKHMILHNFGDELQSTPHFRGLFVFPTINETDQMKVIRICLGFKRTVSIDSYMKMMGIPYGTDDIINHCYGEISSNMHIVDIVENLYSSFDTSFYLTGSTFIEFHSVMAIKVAFSAGLSFDTVFNSRSAKGEDPDSWAHLRKDFPKICEFCEMILVHIQGLKSFNHSFQFTKVSDLHEKLFNIVEIIQRHFPRELITKTGALAAAYEKCCQFWNNEILSLFERFKLSLIHKQEKREAERERRMKLSRRQREIENFKLSQNNILQKLAKLGVKATENDMYDDETKTPEEYAYDVKESQCESDMSSYELFERIKKVTHGIHQVDLLFGKSRLAFSFTGMDIFDLFPIPPSIIEVKKQLEEREKQSKHQEEILTSIFETPNI